MQLLVVVWGLYPLILPNCKVSIYIYGESLISLVCTQSDPINRAVGKRRQSDMRTPGGDCPPLSSIITHHDQVLLVLWSFLLEAITT